MQKVPGVQAASISTALPVLANHGTPFLLEGPTGGPFGEETGGVDSIDQPGLSEGDGHRGGCRTTFSDHGTTDADAAPVILVNQTIVRQFWANQNPLGKRVIIGNLPKPFEVVGVLGDAKNNGLALAPGAEASVFVPYPQLPPPQLYLSVRTSLDPHSLAAALRAQVAAADPDQPLSEIQTMEERLESASASPRFTMLLIAIFSATAFVLAVVGIYGVIAYSVAQRTQELGIRIALGAENRDILRLVVGGGVVLTLTGIAIGLAGSIALTRVMSAMLFETSATDPLILSGSAAIFLMVGVIAGYLPARRAMKIDPTEALRN